MKNPICVSTGCVHELSDDRNILIEKLSKLSPLGIELSFAYPKCLLNFDIKKNNLEYLQGLKFNSIHAPWQDINYGTNEKSKEVLQKISELYKQINAKNVVFHKGQIENYELIINNDFVASIENDDWRKPKHNAKDIKSVLDKNKEFRFTFDFAHALSVSSSDVHKYISYFKEKLIEIHLSVIDRSLEKHDFLHKYDTTETRSSFQYLKDFSVPLVLEAVVFNSEEIELLKKEMDYIRKI